MKSIKIPYRQENHGTFDEEWPIHRGVSGWWYITGYFFENGKPEHLYSYQFTVIKPNLNGLSPWLIQLAFTDIKDNKHYFRQRIKYFGKDYYVNENTVNYGTLGHLVRQDKNMLLSVHNDLFDLEMDLNKGKGATWHCNDGVLIMGNPQKEKERTVYYSYTNLPTSGEVCLHIPGGINRTMQVTGKSWFDRQWGPYHLTDPMTHWEWFSLRFFDDEEVMLFAFPQCSYFDGTYITKDKKRIRLQDYSYTPQEIVVVNGTKFSRGWDLEMPGIKDEKYKIAPLIDGQLNLVYFELIADIINNKDEKVGYCVVELLPGARNPEKKIRVNIKQI